jgi:acyl-CoA thioester hydrolase
MPLAPFRASVLPDWIDYNGHLNVAYYLLVFDRASDNLLDHLGLGAAYRRATNHSIYVLEAHLTYERELRLGDAMLVTTQLIAADRKRLHIFHRMYHGGENYLAATNELMALHVDLAGPRAAPIPEKVFAAVERLRTEHSELPTPPQLGRRIGLGLRSLTPKNTSPADG